MVGGEHAVRRCGTIDRLSMGGELHLEFVRARSERNGRGVAT